MTGTSDNSERLAEQALKAYRSGDYARAAKVFSSARESFQAADLQLRAAEMSNNLCVCLLQLDRAQEALAVVRDTPTTFHNSGKLLLKAQSLGNRAMAKAALGQIPEAEADYRAAANLFRELEHQEGLQYTMQALSKIKLKQGLPMEALDAMQSALSGKTNPTLRDRFLAWLYKIPLRFFGR